MIVHLPFNFRQKKIVLHVSKNVDVKIRALAAQTYFILVLFYQIYNIENILL